MVVQLVIFDNFKDTKTNSHDDVHGAVDMTASYWEFIRFIS